MSNACSLAQLSKTMSNPKYADDIFRLDRTYERSSVINRETILIVVGTTIIAGTSPSFAAPKLFSCLFTALSALGWESRRNRSGILGSKALLIRQDAADGNRAGPTREVSTLTNMVQRCRRGLLAVGHSHWRLLPFSFGRIGIAIPRCSSSAATITLSVVGRGPKDFEPISEHPTA